MSSKKKKKWKVNITKSAAERDAELHGFEGTWKKKEPCCDEEEETKEHDTKTSD